MREEPPTWLTPAERAEWLDPSSSLTTLTPGEDGVLRTADGHAEERVRANAERDRVSAELSAWGCD